MSTPIDNATDKIRRMIDKRDVSDGNIRDAVAEAVEAEVANYRNAIRLSMKCGPISYGPVKVLTDALAGEFYRTLEDVE